MEKDDSIKTLEKNSLSTGKLRKKDWVKKLERASGRPIEFYKKLGIVYIVVDCSSSMAAGTKMEQAKKGAIGFADSAQKKGYSVGIIQFSWDAELMIGPQNNISSLRTEIDKMAANGSTNMTAAILLAMNRLTHEKKERLICIVTDGMPDDEMAAITAAEKAKMKGIDIMTIGTDDADKNFLRKLATREELSIKVPRNELEDGIKSMAKMLPEKSKCDF